MCVHCQRGLCVECAAVIEDVLACRHRHEAQVQDAVQGRLLSLLQARRASSGYWRNAVFYGLAGLAFSGFGILEYRFLGWQAILLFLVGVFLIYAAVANFLESRKHP